MSPASRTGPGHARKTGRRGAATPFASPRIGFVSLGCPKALVDSERILTELRQAGYVITNRYDGADVVIVNTCGFIDSARAESLAAIGEALDENGRVIVTGCLGARAQEIRAAYPRVLAVTGPHQTKEVVAAVREHVAPPVHDPFVDLVPPQGIRLTPRHYAYLKISEGCNHHCSFCIIPSLRGRLASRDFAGIMREAEQLVQAGVQELLVISQDTSAYGSDLGYPPANWRAREWRSGFRDLAAALGELGVWIRLHYVYPYPHVDEVLPLMAAGRVLPYLDIPLQHGSPRILKAMRRPAAAQDTLARIARWRGACPELTLRSTFIVGFPGETAHDFEELLQFLDAAQLDRVGCFPYSPVAGARANALPGAIAEDEKQSRWERFMAHQQRISATRLRRWRGCRMEVLVDAVEDGRAVARSAADAPEIDGVVHVHDGAGLKVGRRYTVEIVDSDEYDLHARPTGPLTATPRGISA